MKKKNKKKNSKSMYRRPHDADNINDGGLVPGLVVKFLSDKINSYFTSTKSNKTQLYIK